MSPIAIRQLARRLGHPRPAVRDAAAARLTALGPAAVPEVFRVFAARDRNAVPLDQLGDELYERHPAFKWLVGCGRSILPFLATRTQVADTVGEALDAVRVMADLTPLPVDSLATELARASGRPAVQAFIVDKLFDLGGAAASAVPALVGVFSDRRDDWQARSLRRTAVFMLGRIARADRPSRALVIPHLLAVASDSEQDDDCRTAALASLAHLDGLPRSALPELARLLTCNEQPQPVRCAAAGVLGRAIASQRRCLGAFVFGGLERIEPLEEAVRLSESLPLLHLADPAGELAGRALLDALADPAAEVRTAAVKALDTAGEILPGALEAVTAALGDRSAKVRMAVTRSLRLRSWFRHDHFLPLVRACVDRNHRVSEVASVVLGRLRADDWVRFGYPTLIDALGSPDQRVSANAATRIRAVGNEMVGPLRDALGNSEKRVRRAAARLLADIEPELLLAAARPASDGLERMGRKYVEANRKSLTYFVLVGDWCAANDPKNWSFSCGKPPTPRKSIIVKWKGKLQPISASNLRLHLIQASAVFQRYFREFGGVPNVAADDAPGVEDSRKVLRRPDEGYRGNMDIYRICEPLGLEAHNLAKQYLDKYTK